MLLVIDFEVYWREIDWSSLRVEALGLDVFEFVEGRLKFYIIIVVMS